MNIIKRLMLCAVMVFSLLALPGLATTTVHAATPKEELCRGSGGRWVGGTCQNRNQNAPLEVNFKKIVNIFLFIIGAIAVIMIVIGGLKYVTSNGDTSSVTNAKNTILYAVIGLIVAILAYSIVDFVVDQLV